MAVAPTQCQAGRSPLGRTGMTDAEVWPCGGPNQTTDIDSFPAEHRQQAVAHRVGADGAEGTDSCPKPTQYDGGAASCPRRESLIICTSWPCEPSGMDAIPMTWVSRTCTPTTAISTRAVAWSAFSLTGAYEPSGSSSRTTPKPIRHESATSMLRISRWI